VLSITTGYIVAGAFEVVGVAWVVGDVYFDRRRARNIVAERNRLPRPPGRGRWIYGGLTSQRRGPHSASSYRESKERRKQEYAEIQHEARKTALVEAEILDMLRAKTRP
jgi:aromatic ring-cleaving dioxygenase